MPRLSASSQPRPLKAAPIAAAVPCPFIADFKDLPNASLSEGHISLSTNRPNRPAKAHCNSRPICAYAHIGPTRPATSLSLTLEEDNGNAPNTNAIRTEA